MGENWRGTGEGDCLPLMCKEERQGKGGRYLTVASIFNGMVSVMKGPRRQDLTVKTLPPPPLYGRVGIPWYTGTPVVSYHGWVLYGAIHKPRALKPPAGTVFRGHSSQWLHSWPMEVFHSTE